VSHSHWIEHIPLHQAFHKLHTYLHPFSFLVSALILPIKWFSYEDSNKKSLSPTKEGSLKKKERKGKEQGSKVKEVKSHLPIQGHKKLHEKEKKRMRNSRKVGDTFLKESENRDHIFL
jgi:hypothetical protein